MQTPNIMRRVVPVLAVILTALAAAVIAPCAKAQPAARDTGYAYSGPYTYKNLTVYLVHGKDALKQRNILTLQEAMKRKLVKVYETGDVNELAIRNFSKEYQVFVQAGDIVRGGRQDRTLSNDLILPTQSGKVKIASFCVESGRWTKRGGEADGEFASSNNQISGRELKIAAKLNKEQGEVWSKVSQAQQKLTASTGTTVNSPVSETSMELTLDNDKVQALSKEYRAALLKIIDGKPDVIGFAFAINGTINSADVYASNGLFTKLWPKLLNASIVEAISESASTVPFTPPTQEAVRTTLAEPDAAPTTDEDVNDRVRVSTQRTQKNVKIETRDRSESDAWIHRSYIRLE